MTNTYNLVQINNNDAPYIILYRIFHFNNLFIIILYSKW